MLGDEVPGEVLRLLEVRGEGRGGEGGVEEREGAEQGGVFESGVEGLGAGVC